MALWRARLLGAGIDGPPGFRNGREEMADGAIGSRESRGRTTSAEAPVPAQSFQDPLSPRVASWLLRLIRLSKGLRVYADNNEMLQRFLDDAVTEVEGLFELLPEISLTIREDRLLHGRDAVLINADRDDGLPFLLYRNTFRRLTFVRGLDRPELLEVARVLAAQDQGFDRSGADDLVSSFWRLNPQHVRYLTIDVLTMQANTAKSREDVEDIARVQNDIENIVASIYKTDVSDDDLVRGLSITREDLEALKEVRRDGGEEDVDLLDHATARSIADVSEEDLEIFRAQLAQDTPDQLSRKLMDVLLEIVFLGQASQEASPVIGLLTQLFDSFLLAHRYAMATELLDRLTTAAQDSTDFLRLHIGRLLLKLLANESRIQPVLMVFNDDRRAASIGDILRLMRAVGPDVVPVLLRSLPSINAPAHRRLICDLIVDFGVPAIEELVAASKEAPWFFVRDLLSLAQHHAPDASFPLVRIALKHEHAKVREQAIGLLRSMSSGIADDLVGEALLDLDADVRFAAVRVAVARGHPKTRAILEALLTAADVEERSLRELRFLATAYATLSGDQAVAVLDRMLNPGLIARLKGSDTQLAAAYALASLGTEPARIALQKGLRTLNAKVRDACRRALSRESMTEDVLAHGSYATDPHASVPVPAPMPGAADVTQSRASSAQLARDSQPQREIQAGSPVPPPSQRLSPSLDDAPTDPQFQRRRTEPQERIPGMVPPPALMRTETLPEVRIDEPETAVTPVAHWTRDVIPSNLPPAPGSRDVMPLNLPPAPGSRDVMPSNLPPAPGSRDVMPLNLPPAPGSRDAMLSNLPPPPPELPDAASDLEDMFRDYLGDASANRESDSPDQSEDGSLGDEADV